MFSWQIPVVYLQKNRRKSIHFLLRKWFLILTLSTFLPYAQFWLERGGESRGKLSPKQYFDSSIILVCRRRTLLELRKMTFVRRQRPRMLESSSFRIVVFLLFSCCLKGTKNWSETTKMQHCAQKFSRDKISKKAAGKPWWRCSTCGLFYQGERKTSGRDFWGGGGGEVAAGTTDNQQLSIQMPRKFLLRIRRTGEDHNSRLFPWFSPAVAIFYS